MKTFFLAFCSFIALTFVSPIHAEVIRGYDAQITIQKEGTIQVREKIDYDFGYDYKHGIYRDIPYIKKNSDGKEYELTVQVHSIKDEAGNAYTYKQSWVNNKLNIKIGDADRTITGLHTYIIDYTVSGALTYYSDHDELYWNITGTDWQVNQENVNGTVRFPEGIDMKTTKTICFTGISGSKAQDCNVLSENNTTSVSSPLVEYGQGLTIVSRFPKGLVAVLEPKPYTAFENTWYGKLILGLIFALLGILALIWYIGLPLYIPINWYLHGRDPKSQSVRVWFDPPKAKGRVLTPAETGALIDETVDMRDMFGSLIQLAQRGYFQIVEEKKGQFVFKKKKEWVSDGLLPFERELLDGLFNGSEECKLKGRDLSAEMQRVTEKLYTQVVHDGFFKENPQNKRTQYYVLGGIALVTGNIALSIIAFIFGKNMPAKTGEGAQQASIARSLKTFLSSQERQIAFSVKKSDLPAGRQVMFEKLLPFAIAFGVEKIWAERFKDLAFSNPSWYVGQNNTAFNAMYLSNSLHSSVSTFSHSATPTRSSSGFSSGFSGGGFSGGGGGGGGGGSW